MYHPYSHIPYFVLSALMGSKTPPQNAAKAKKLGGAGPIKVRGMIISGDEENPTD